jgi:hypothetical protein
MDGTGQLGMGFLMPCLTGARMRKTGVMRARPDPDAYPEHENSLQGGGERLHGHGLGAYAGMEGSPVEDSLKQTADLDAVLWQRR